MAALKKAYEVFCVDEQGWQRVVGSTLPTECPNDAGHTIEPGSAHVIEDPAREYKPELFLDFENDNHVKRNTSSGVKRFLPIFDSEVEISKDGTGDYTSIKAAIAANPGPLVIYRVGPGTYVEDNPIVVPTQCSLISSSGPENTFIVAANANTHVVSLNLVSRVEGFLITGAAGPDGRGIFFDGTGTPGQVALVKECIIRDCSVGVEVANGAPNALNIFRMQIVGSAAQIDGCIDVHSQGRLIGGNVIAAGSPLQYAQFGARVRDVGSQLTLDTFMTQFCQAALCADNGGEARVSQLLLEYNTNALHFGSSGTASSIHCVGAVMRQNTTDLLIEATDAQITILSSHMDRKKITNVNDVTINTDFATTDNSKHFRTITGDIRVGTINNASKFVAGYGKHYFESMAVLLNDNLEAGSWTDRSTEAASSESSTWDLFAGTAVGNCVYIGSDYMFCGMKVKVTAAVSSSDIIWEYWNGSSWTAFGTMATQSAEPYHSRGKQFVGQAERQHFRFGFMSTVGAVKKTLNSVEKYWVRGRVAATLPGLPVLEQIQLHTPGTMEINSYGITEFTGDSRYWAKLPLSINSSLNSQDLHLSSTLFANCTGNQFISGQNSRVTALCRLPENADTSFPIKLEVVFMVTDSAAGDIRLAVHRAVSVEGSSVHTTATGMVASETSDIYTVSIGSNEESTVKAVRYSVDISDALPRGTCSLLWLNLERQGADAADTYGGTMNVIDIFGLYVVWCSGGHLQLHTI